MSFQAFLHNKTPFAAAKFVLANPDGQETVLVVVSATFEAPAQGPLKLSDEQTPVRAADEYNGNPETSSVRWEADVALEKANVDVIINGRAFAPAGRRATEVHVHLSVADVRKDLLVSGDRFWRAGPFGLSVSSPEPFGSMPVIYERAFGGSHGTASERRNLVGVGFRGARSGNPVVQTEIPNVEYPNARLKSKNEDVIPAGLGVVGRAWLPRIGYAGTYDKEWLERHWPLLPRDFDPRFNQCVPADQQSQRIRGGETVRLVNLSPEGEWTFDLPTLRTPISFLYDGRSVESELHLDTIAIEPDLRRVTMTSRAAMVIKRNKGLLREIVVGHVTKAWVRARVKRKLYLDYSGRGGVPDHASLYEL